MESMQRWTLLYQIWRRVHLQICGFMMLVLVFPTTYTLHTLETPIREAFLKPRNFNPHPYKQPYYHLHDFQSTDLNGITTNYIDIDQAVHNTKTTELFPARHPSNGIRRYSDWKKEYLNTYLNTNKNNKNNKIIFLCISFSQAPHQFPPTVARGVNSRSFLFTDPYAKKRFQQQSSKVSHSYISRNRPALSSSIHFRYISIFGIIQNRNLFVSHIHYVLVLIFIGNILVKLDF